MTELKIKSVMTKKVECIDESATLGDALSLMSEKNISCLIVVENDRPIGVFTERDVVRIFASEQPDLNKNISYNLLVL